MPVFWLGPLGALRALPSPSLDSGPEANSTRYGATHRSLSGRPTIDLLGVRRTWTLSWPFLDAATHAYLDALHLGLITEPVWLIDPQRPNRLPVPVASTGSTTRTTERFTTTAGTLAWIPSSLGALPAAGGLAWTVSAEGGRLDATGRVPLPDTGPVTFSAYAAATRPVRLTATTETTTGNPLSTHDSDPVTPEPTGTRLTLTVTPPAGAAACRVALTTPPGTAATITTTGWQLEAGRLATPWNAGGGAAVVLVESLRVTYPLPGSYATTLTLLEA